MASAPLTEGAWPQKEKERHRDVFLLTTIYTKIYHDLSKLDDKWDVI
jgi:hypothetical protein